MSLTQQGFQVQTENQNNWDKPKNNELTRETIISQTYTPPTEFTFNFGRLVKEVDDMVKSRTEKIIHAGEYVKDRIAESLDDYTKEYGGKIDRLIEHKYSEIHENLKNSVMEEFMKGRTIINIPHLNISDVSIGQLDHPQFEDVFMTLVTFKKVMMVGKAGTGKTFMAEQFAEKLSLPFYKYSGSRDSSVHDLLGYKQPRSEEYLETAFLNAYENGGVFLVDEYDACSGDMALFFNGISDNSKSISIPHRDTKPVAHKHENFYIIFSGNTWGGGSMDYSARDFQDMALLDRFRFARHEVDYHTILEKTICNCVSIELHKWILELRAGLEEIGSYLSTRNVEDIVKYLGVKYSYLLSRVDPGKIELKHIRENLYKALTNILNGIDSEEASKVRTRLELEEPPRGDIPFVLESEEPEVSSSSNETTETGFQEAIDSFDNLVSSFLDNQNSQQDIIESGSEYLEQTNVFDTRP